MKDLDATLSALADPTRRRVVDLLRTGPRRAGELAASAETSAPAMSRHLRVLRATGLV
jgi:DNA-binding transcriptional ArsR family regulator